MKLIDRIGDFLGTSGYAKDRRLAKDFLGVSLDRETYESVRDNEEFGTLNQNFGNRARAYRHRKTPGERMQLDISKQILSHMTRAGVTFDLDSEENQEAASILSRAVVFSAINDKTILKFGAPYDGHAPISEKQQHYKEKFPEATDTPLVA